MYPFQFLIINSTNYLTMIIKRIVIIIIILIFTMIMSIVIIIVNIIDDDNDYNFQKKWCFTGWWKYSSIILRVPPLDILESWLKTEDFSCKNLLATKYVDWELANEITSSVLHCHNIKAVTRPMILITNIFYSSQTIYSR